MYLGPQFAQDVGFGAEDHSPHGVPEQVAEKQRVVVQIAPDQTARFRGHPIEPSQAAPLHPAWGIGSQPGVHVKGLTHREQDPVLDQRFNPGYPALLLRGAQTHPNEVGFETP